MGEVYATGSWRPFAGQEEVFLAEWRAFMGWACSLPGARGAVLTRDVRDHERFVSISTWDDMESLRAWKSSPDFKPRMSRVQAHIDEFAPTELEIVAAVGD